MLPPRPARLRRLPATEANAEAPDVTVYVASCDTRIATELCIRSMRELADHPFSLVVGDSRSGDGSLDMLRRFEERGWLELEVAPDRRLHSEWLDRWRASCPTRLALFVDSDVEALRSGWLRVLVDAWASSGAAVVCAEYLDDLRRFVEPVGGEVVRAAPRPAPWLLLLDVPQTRVVDASFAFDKEWSDAFPERLVHDVGARFYREARERGLHAVQLPRSFARYYRHYAGLSWRRQEPPARIAAMLTARLERLRLAQDDGVSG